MREYLEFIEFKSHWKAFSIASILLMSLGAAGALTTAILGAAGVIGPGPLLWAITNVVGAMLLGGLGSFWGVVAAALLVGLVKGVMVGIGYSAASTAAIYLLMLLVLVFRPRGLFGERITRFE